MIVLPYSASIYTRDTGILFAKRHLKLNQITGNTIMNFTTFRWLAIFSILLVSCTKTIDSPPPQGKLSDEVKPLHYNLDVTVDPNQTSFSGKLAIDIHLSTALNQFYLHGQDLNIKQAFLKNSKNKKIKVKVSKTPLEGVLKFAAEQKVSNGDINCRLIIALPLMKTCKAYIA